MNMKKQFLKEFYEDDARQQEEHGFVKYTGNFEEMYENLSYFEKYYVKERQKEFLIEINNGRIIGKTILDCGCGEGFISLALSHCGANVIAIDLSSNKIRMAKRLESCSRSGNVNFIVADAESLPFKQKVCDIAILSEIIEHLPNPKVCLKEISFILNKCGTLYVTVPKSNKKGFSFLENPRNTKDADYMNGNNFDFDPHIQSFTRDEFLYILQSCGFSAIAVRGIVFPMPSKLSPILRMPVILKFANFLFRPIMHLSILFTCRKISCHTQNAE